MIKRGLVLYLILSCFWNSFSLGSYRIHLSSAWYPDKKNDLLDSLNECNQYAQQHYNMHLDPSKIRAIICPHAGFNYSGSIAAAAYQLLAPNFFKRIIILAPSHHHSFKGVGLPGKQYLSYKNVLGSIELDKKVLKALSQETSLCSYQEHAHELDHSINVQIPFIQRFCGKQCLLVPLLIGDVTIDQVDEIANLLRSYIDPLTLIIVSSDFTHYGKRFSYEPFKDQQDIKNRICQLDSSLVVQIQKQNLQNFDQLLQDTKATICGRNSIKILLALLEQKVLGDIETYIVGYNGSGFDQRKIDHSVSYVSCVFSNEKKESLSPQNLLTGYEKGVLLSMARECIDNAVSHQSLYDEDKKVVAPGLLTQALQQPCGTFVTLYKMGHDGYKQLRGCIGTITASKPLYESVCDMAIKAALHDIRFKPVSVNELRYLDVSVSVLTDAKAVASYHDIILDRDGVVLNYQDKSAVYLPYVAKEQGWNLEQMLASLSQKAGLFASAWKDSHVRFKIFQSCDFSEGKDPLDVMYEGYKK